MRTVILTVAMTIGMMFTTTAQVKGINNENVYLFYVPGIEFYTWNRQIMTNHYTYLNRPSDNNIDLYNEAIKVLSANGFKYEKPTTDNSNLDDFNEDRFIINKVPYSTSLFIDKEYSNKNITIRVRISDDISLISINKN